MLRMNEAHDLGESERTNRFALYERVKIYAATPPEVLACNEKHLRQYYVPNVLGLIITTNHKTGGVYLPSDDRRHYIAWSQRTKEEFTAEYFNELWRWLLYDGGNADVAAYLMQRDLSAFDPCALPPQTAAFFEIVNAARSPEDAELADALDELKQPDVCSVSSILACSAGAALEWLLDRRYRRSLPHRMERCGYIACRNPETEDGTWRINGRRQTLCQRDPAVGTAPARGARLCPEAEQTSRNQLIRRGHPLTYFPIAARQLAPGITDITSPSRRRRMNLCEPTIPPAWKSRKSGTCRTRRSHSSARQTGNRRCDRNRSPPD